MTPSRTSRRAAFWAAAFVVAAVGSPAHSAEPASSNPPTGYSTGGGYGTGPNAAPNDRRPFGTTYNYDAWGIRDGRIDTEFLNNLIGDNPDFTAATLQGPPPIDILRRRQGSESTMDDLVIGPDGLIRRGAAGAGAAAQPGYGTAQPGYGAGYPGMTASGATPSPVNAARARDGDPSTKALNSLLAAGYLNIQNLHATSDGRFEASAAKNGRTQTVMLDSSGKITTRN